MNGVTSRRPTPKGDTSRRKRTKYFRRDMENGIQTSRLFYIEGLQITRKTRSFVFFSCLYSPARKSADRNLSHSTLRPRFCFFYTETDPSECDVGRGVACSAKLGKETTISNFVVSRVQAALLSLSRPHPHFLRS